MVLVRVTCKPIYRKSLLCLRKVPAGEVVREIQEGEGSPLLLWGLWGLGLGI